MLKIKIEVEYGGVKFKKSFIKNDINSLQKYREFFNKCRKEAEESLPFERHHHGKEPKEKWLK